MVDTVNLALFKVLAHLVVDFTGGVEGGAQRFFHHHARGLGVEFCFTQAFADSAKGARRHGEVVDGNAILLIEHVTETGKCGGIVDVKVTEIEASAERIPEAFIDFLFHEGLERFTHDFGVLLFIPVRTPYPKDTRLRVELDCFF